MEDHAKKIGIPPTHTLVQSKESEWAVRKGQDTDTYWYNEIDPTGAVVASYILRDTTSTFPPFDRSVSFDKVG